MKRGDNSLLYLYQKGKIRLILYYKIQLEIFLKNLSHIAPVSPILNLWWICGGAKSIGSFRRQPCLSYGPNFLFTLLFIHLIFKKEFLFSQIYSFPEFLKSETTEYRRVHMRFTTSISWRKPENKNIVIFNHC